MSRKPNGTGPIRRFAEKICRACLSAFAVVLVLSAADPAAADSGVTIVAPMEEQVVREPDAVKKKKKKSAAVKTPEGMGGEQKEEPADNAGSKAPETKESKAKEPPYGGIFYGQISSVDPEGSSIFVVPLDKHYSRKIFYIDKFTDYFIDGEPDELESLHINQRVAVRFFGEQAVRVAEAVYVVSGEFNPEDYRPVKKKKAAGKKEAGKKEKTKGKKKENSKGNKAGAEGSGDDPAEEGTE